MGTVGTWYLRLTRPAADGASVLAIRNDRRPDGTIDVADTEPVTMTDGCYLRAHCDAEGRVSRLAPVPAGGPPLWFVEVRESSAEPPAVNLVAFTGQDVPIGTLLDGAAESNLSVSSGDQVGALRWWPATGEVDQIYVAPAWRRNRVGTTLVLSAGCLSIARQWPRMWGDGQRTELGESFVTASVFGHRVAPLEHVLAPMTPPSQPAQP